MSDSGTSGAQTFRSSGESYDRFMGRYSAPLAVTFADAAGIDSGQSALDVGCGPGALIAELVRRLGVENVAAVDPSESFVEACRRRHPAAEVKLGRAEKLPYPDDGFDTALAQLVLHFVDDPRAAAEEMGRVVRPGGVVGACVWDMGGGMRMLRLFWDSARALDPSSPDEAGLGFVRDGEIAELFERVGLTDVRSGALDVEARYEDFDEFWTPFLGATGPAGSFVASLDVERQARLRDDLRVRLGSPGGPFTLGARAWYAIGRA